MADKTNLNFGQALDAAKAGNKVARTAWGENIRWITFSQTQGLEVNYPDISGHSWDQIEQEDVLSEDWTIL